MRQKVEQRNKTAQEALSRLMALCSKAEKSSGDARRLLWKWGVPIAEHDAVVAELVRQRFIDDERYAGAFVHEKLRLSGWGPFKIRAALAAKGIDPATIGCAMEQAAPETKQGRLRALLERKMKTTKATSAWDLRGKLARYAQSQGYGYDEIKDAIDSLDIEE